MPPRTCQRRIVENIRRSDPLPVPFHWHLCYTWWWALRNLYRKSCWITFGSFSNSDLSGKTAGITSAVSRPKCSRQCRSLFCMSRLSRYYLYRSGVLLTKRPCLSGNFIRCIILWIGIAGNRYKSKLHESLGCMNNVSTVYNNDGDIIKRSKWCAKMSHIICI